MDIVIKKLTPELVEEYIHFFDTTPHDDNLEENKCYCVVCSNDDCEGKDFSTAQKRKEYAYQYVKNNNIQGYLAYCGDKIVGWCNANTKADCLKCSYWRNFLVYAPLDDIQAGLKVKSVFCFVIAPQMKRKGIATMLLERVCKDAAEDGFDMVEAYPFKESAQTCDFGGYVEMYKKLGFYTVLDAPQGIVMRKRLK